MAKKTKVEDMDADYHEIQAALDELQRITAIRSDAGLIQQQVVRIRRASQAIQARILESPYFRDAWPLAAARLMQGKSQIERVNAINDRKVETKLNTIAIVAARYNDLRGLHPQWSNRQIRDEIRSTLVVPAQKIGRSKTGMAKRSLDSYLAEAKSKALITPPPGRKAVKR
jgi:hypothetical protein